MDSQTDLCIHCLRGVSEFGNWKLWQVVASIFRKSLQVFIITVNINDTVVTPKAMKVAPISRYISSIKKYLMVMLN